MKKAKDMNDQERKAALDEIKLKELKSAADSEPLDMSKTAKEMSDLEKAQWMAAHRRRFGS